MNPRRRAVAVSIACALVAHSMAPFFASGRPQQPATILPDGTEFTVITAQEISSKYATEGDPVNFRVAEDVIVDGRVVIAKGTLAKGTVTSTVRSGRGGKGGKLSVRLESTYTVDRQLVKLRAAKGKGGDDKTGSVIALTMFVSVFFLLKKGKDAKIKEGTPIQVFTDEEKLVGPGVVRTQVVSQQAATPTVSPKPKKKEKPWHEMSKP